MGSEWLAVDDIEVIYDGAILAVAGVSLKVEQGGIVALLGALGEKPISDSMEFFLSPHQPLY